MRWRVLTVLAVTALAATGLWLWLAGAPDASMAGADRLQSTIATAPISPGESSSADASASSDTAPATTALVELILLPDGIISADPKSVRIGLARISAEDAQSYQAWLEGGKQGAGPESREELASVERWINPTAVRHADGAIVVNLAGLPWADRYDLQARAEDGLRFYSASFTAAAHPASISPMVAAGIRIADVPARSSKVKLLLRRTAEWPDAARWQALMVREDPALLSRFDDTAIEVSAGQILAPLPPGEIEVIWQVDNIEASREAISLRAGALTDIALDPVDHGVADALSASLEIQFLVAGTREPVRDLRVSLAGDTGDQQQNSDSSGMVRFDGVDRQKIARLGLEFPKPESPLPQWPMTKAIGLDLVEETSADQEAKLIRKTVELRPLQWLLVRTGPVPFSTERRAGNPYPIYALQMQQTNQWSDVAADYFLAAPEGLAVSLETPADVRALVLLSPWSVLYSTAANTRKATVDGKHRVELIPDAGHSLLLRLFHEGVPASGLPVVVRGPIKSLPATTLTTDAQGLIRLDAVTVPTVQLEAPGFEVVEVDSTPADVLVELQAEASAQP